MRPLPPQPRGFLKLARPGRFSVHAMRYLSPQTFNGKALTSLYPKFSDTFLSNKFEARYVRREYR